MNMKNDTVCFSAVFRFQKADIDFETEIYGQMLRYVLKKTAEQQQQQQKLSHRKKNA